MSYLDSRPANEVYGRRAMHEIITDTQAVLFEPRGGQAFERLVADVPALLEQIAELRARVDGLEDS